MLANIVTLGGRLTWTKPNGEWGLGDVDLSTLPPAVYGALCKLKHYEDELDKLRTDRTQPELPEEMWL